jgi:hypothetical protein
MIMSARGEHAMPNNQPASSAADRDARASGTWAQQAVQVALDRRDNGGDAGARDA